MMLLDIHLFDRASHADVVDGEFICIRGCSVGGANLRLWVELNLKLSIYLSGVYILACRAPARLLSLMSGKKLLILLPLVASTAVMNVRLYLLLLTLDRPGIIALPQL